MTCNTISSSSNQIIVLDQGLAQLWEVSFGQFDSFVDGQLVLEDGAKIFEKILKFLNWKSDFCNGFLWHK